MIKANGRLKRGIVWPQDKIDFLQVVQVYNIAIESKYLIFEVF